MERYPVLFKVPVAFFITFYKQPLFLYRFGIHFSYEPFPCIDPLPHLTPLPHLSLVTCTRRANTIIYAILFDTCYIICWLCYMHGEWTDCQCYSVHHTHLIFCCSYVYLRYNFFCNNTKVSLHWQYTLKSFWKCASILSPWSHCGDIDSRPLYRYIYM